jgi:hypothetical protein
VTDEATFPEQLAQICFEAADLILNPLAVVAPADTDPEPRWAFERRMWREARGTDEPMDWVSLCTSTYLIEAAHQVRAVGVLLQTGAVTASLDPLVRAVVERVGRVKWILDPECHPARRGSRAGLEVGVSMTAYRTALERLGADRDICKEWKGKVRAHRKLLEDLFTVEKPPSDPCDPDSKPSEDMSLWVVEGEPYPDYGTNAGHALETESTTHAQGKATYGGLSGFSHPSVIFSREHRTIDGDGGVTYTYLFTDLERSARHVAFGVLDGFRYWTAYYDAAPDAVQARIDDLGDRMDSISVIGDPSD